MEGGCRGEWGGVGGWVAGRKLGRSQKRSPIRRGIVAGNEGSAAGKAVKIRETLMGGRVGRRKQLFPPRGVS